MEKTSLGGGKGGERGEGSGPLTLDHCARCGGMWFELGEVQRLRSERPESLWAKIPARDERHRAQCHTCRALVDRDAPDCAACGAKTRLYCPCCDTKMLQFRQADLTLDVCKLCQGVWFDHHELEAIWEMERDRLVARGRGGRVARTTEVGSGGSARDPLLGAGPRLRGRARRRAHRGGCGGSGADRARGRRGCGGRRVRGGPRNRGWHLRLTRGPGSPRLVHPLRSGPLRRERA